MKFFYSASVMGYGFGYDWHKKYNFPNFSRVTRTLTWDKKLGMPFAIFKYNDTVWNRVGLHNIGFFNWLLDYTFYDNSMYNISNIIVSIAGYDWQIEDMIEHLEISDLNPAGIELNFSCPNVKSFNNRVIPKSNYPLYLKLNCNQDPYEYDLDNVVGIRMNSVPGKYLGGWSGKAAKQKNWEFIKKFNHEGLNVARCSMTHITDMWELYDLGCKEIGIGSLILTNPEAVEQIKEG